ncbi:MAG: hypothetical protein ACYCXW_07060 [Solirubrobacteraceae bacterium]
MSAPSSLDAHLAEIDRRLRAIQSGLEESEAAPTARREVAREPAQVVSAAVSAGPFHSLGALSRFERALSQLPGVRDVRLREYEGGDRAVYEVMLDPPIS